ncbi:MAG TPA: FkbM family methyltransferase [Terracidiphilus sp.]|jgi:FkbM family methyltransferase
MQTKEALHNLLDESPSACQLRQKNSFDEHTGGKDLVLFGAGGLGRKVLAALRGDGVEPLAFADNKLAGGVVEGVQVMTPSEAAERWGKSAAFVVTIWASWADTMQEQVGALSAFGCETVVSFIPLLWKYPGLLSHVQVDLPSRVLEQRDLVSQAFELWSDDSSREEFVAQLRWRLWADFDGLSRPVPDQYFQRDLIRLGYDAVFVDAGAFDGDTLAQFLSFADGRFRSAYLFEPDPRNLRSLKERLSRMPEDIRKRVEIFEAAVGESEYKIEFNSGLGASSAPGSGTDCVQCVSLDNTLSESPSLIKFDIEGFELLGLAGSRRIIANHSPSLAVCAYHVQSHLWEIPLLIHSFNPTYQFYLRPHGQIWETICYAIPI